MPWKNSESRYSTMSVALHWLMVVLLAVVYACIEFRGIFPKGSGGRALIVEMHFMFGLTVFVLVWLRLFARSLGVAPKIVPAPPQWQSLPTAPSHRTKCGGRYVPKWSKNYVNLSVLLTIKKLFLNISCSENHSLNQCYSSNYHYN